MFVVRAEGRDECAAPQITEEPVRRGECAWNEGKEEEIKKGAGRGREFGWGKKNNRKPAGSNGAAANPPEIKQPAATSRIRQPRCTFLLSWSQLPSV